MGNKMEKKKTVRNSNIELLRILAIGGVIVLHFNNANIGGGFNHVANNSMKLYLLYVLESISICAVDVFILISGYFMVESYRRDIKKVLTLLIQVSIFGVAIYSFRVIFGEATFSVKGLLSAFLPANYFVILYVVLYLISPYINIIFSKLSFIDLKQMMVLLFLLFSVWPTAVDVLCEISGKEIVGLSSVGAYGSQWGYSLINFILLYIIGGYLRKCDAKSFVSKRFLFFAFFTCLGVLVLWARCNDKIGFFAERSAWEYCNPFVIGEAVSLFLIFAQQKPRYSRLVNHLAGGVFTVFLLHSVLIVPQFIAEMVSKSLPMVIILYMIYSSYIFIVCVIIHCIYDAITKPIFNRLFKKIKTVKIDVLD